MFQYAIDHAKPGDTVDMGEGTWRIDETIVLRNGVRLRGWGPKATILRTNFRRPQPVIECEGDDLSISNLAIDGSDSPQVTAGILLTHCTRATLEHLSISHLIGTTAGGEAGPHAVLCVAGVTHSLFSDITCDDIGIKSEWGGGIRLAHGSSNDRIEHCTITNTGRGGIFCNDGSTDNIILANTVRGSGLAGGPHGGVGLGIEVQNCDRSLIVGNTIDHWLSVDHSDGSAVRDNRIAADDGTVKLCGIEIVNTHDDVIVGNTVEGGEKVGLSISGPEAKTHLYFRGNAFQAANTWGVQIQGDAGGAADLFFDANLFTGTTTGPFPLYPDQGIGVRFNGHVRNAVFMENRIVRNAGSAIQVTGDGVSDLDFHQNDIAGNGKPTIDADHWDTVNHDAAVSSVPLHVDVNGRSVTATVSANSTHWLWDFGDGLPANGNAATHTYTRAGKYTLVVIGWDPAGHACRCEKTIDIP